MMPNNPIPHPAMAADADADASIEKRIEQVRRFIAAKGFYGSDAEDLRHMMLVEILEAPPEKTLALQYVYLHALDKLRPRHYRHGVRSRCHAPPAGPAPPGPELQSHHDKALAALPEKGAVRAMLLLLGPYGFSQREIAKLWGLTESRISQILASLQRDPLPTSAALLDDQLLCLACDERPRCTPDSRARFCVLCRVKRAKASAYRARERAKQ